MEWVRNSLITLAVIIVGLLCIMVAISLTAQQPEIQEFQVETLEVLDPVPEEDLFPVLEADLYPPPGSEWEVIEVTDDAFCKDGICYDEDLFRNIDVPEEVILARCMQPEIPQPGLGERYRMGENGVLTPSNPDEIGIFQDFKFLEYR